MKLVETTAGAIIIPWFRRRGLVIPAVCYSSCNNAFLEAQVVGKTPSLCEPNSTFYAYYSACNFCIQANIGDTGDVGDYINPTLGEYLDYCNNSSPASSGTQSTTGTTAPASTSSNAPPTGHTIVITVSVTATIDGEETVWPFPRTIVSYAPISDTKVVTWTTIENGKSTTWLFTTTFTHLSAAVFDTSTRTITGTTTHTSAPTASDPASTGLSQGTTQRSQAWIAGPVVGAVGGVGILALAAWFLLRVRRYRKTKQTGHEVHGDSALKSELETKEPPQELGGEEPPRHVAELPSNNL